MLGIDRQSGGSRAVEPGADPGIFGGQRRSRVCGPESSRGVRLGEPGALPTGLYGIEAERAGIGATLPGEDDRAEPGAGDTPDHGTSARRGSEDARVSAVPLPSAVHARRHRFAGEGG